MSRWLYNLICSSLAGRFTGVIEIHCFDGGLSNVIKKESFKQPNNTEALAVV